MRTDVLGVKFDNLNMDEAAAKALELKREHTYWADKQSCHNHRDKGYPLHLNSLTAV